MSISKDEVIACFRRVLKRDPESESTIEQIRKDCGTVDDLCRTMVQSPEFCEKWSDKAGKGPLLVYGVGAHLLDMIAWYPDLPGRIGRIFDKDPQKIGQNYVPCGGLKIEPQSALRDVAAGSWIAIAAIRYYAEIAVELRTLNPGLRCIDFDEVAFMNEGELQSLLYGGRHTGMNGQGAASSAGLSGQWQTVYGTTSGGAALHLAQRIYLTAQIAREQRSFIFEGLE